MTTEELQEYLDKCDPAPGFSASMTIKLNFGTWSAHVVGSNLDIIGKGGTLDEAINAVITRHKGVRHDNDKH